MALIRTDVSEDRIASIFRVNECEQAQSEVVSSCIGNSFTLKMEAIRSSETSVLIRATRRHLPEDDNHHSHRRGNLKSYIPVRVHGFVVKYLTEDSPRTYSIPHSNQNLVNWVGIFVTPDSCVLRIYITGYVKVYFIDCEEQLRIYESIANIFHYTVAKLNRLWSINRFKLVHNSNSIWAKLYLVALEEETSVLVIIILEISEC
jgi:hypothetical protein